MKIRFAELSWVEIEEIQKKPNIIILPVGSTEQHGPHLPINVDSYCPTYIAEKAANEINKKSPVKALVAPTVYYTEVATFDGYPGTIGVQIDTIAKYLEDITVSFTKNGFNNLLIVNGHSSNIIPINTALRKANIKFPNAGYYAVNWWSIGTDTILDTIQSKPCLHAEEIETSVSLWIQPENVNMEKSYCEYPTLSLSEKWVTPDFYGLTKHVFYHSRKKYPKYNISPGVMGDAKIASSEKGKIIVEAVVKDLCELIIEIVESEKNY